MFTLWYKITNFGKLPENQGIYLENPNKCLNIQLKKIKDIYKNSK